jgi:hypothetical protein
MGEIGSPEVKGIPPCGRDVISSLDSGLRRNDDEITR